MAVLVASEHHDTTTPGTWQNRLVERIRNKIPAAMLKPGQYVHHARQTVQEVKVYPGDAHGDPIVRVTLVGSHNTTFVHLWPPETPVTISTKPTKS